jgi:MFS family permease
MLFWKQNPARLAMLAACAAVFLTALDQTVVVTALPQMIQDLEIQPLQLDHAAWIVSGYLLGYVIVMPLMGRVSDLYGRRRVLLICLGIFALGSLFCGWSPLLGKWFSPKFLQPLGIDVSSPGLIWLVLARFVQAAGGGAVVPVAMAVAGDFYGYRKRAVVLGLIGMVTEAGGVLGPLYGSLIVQWLGWPAIFYLNIPIVAVLAYLMIRFIPTRSVVTEQTNASRRIDIFGALLFGASLLCLSTGLSLEAAQITPATLQTSSSTQNNPWLIALALVLLAAFIAWELISERRKQSPLIVLSLFKRPMFSATALLSFLIGVALITAMVNIPLFFLSVFGETDIASGLALLRLTAMIPVGALLGGWLCGRLTCRWTAVLGLVPTSAGFWLMHLWPLQIDWTLITAGTLLAGLGLGLVISPISTTAMNAVAPQQLGMASALVTVLRMVGMILGLAALTSWGLERFRALVASAILTQGITALDPRFLALVANSAHTIYTDIFLAVAILCLIALLPALFLQGKQTSATPVRSNEEGNDTDPAADVASSEEHEPADPQPESEASSLHGQRER